LMALMAEQGMPARRVVSEDSFIATGPAYAATMPSVDSILAGALA
jgi:2-oxoisovalerate dehydrogenase E1 component